MKYDYDKRDYVFMHCEYETENYTLISKKESFIEGNGQVVIPFSLD